MLTHRGFATITLPAADRWMERLLPHLTGEHSRVEFLDGLEGEQRDFVERLLRALVAGGMVSELDPNDSTAPQNDAVVELIGYTRSDPRAAYARWCELDTIIVGKPQLAACLRDSFNGSGIRSIRVHDDAGIVGDQLATPSDHVVHIVLRDQFASIATYERVCRAGDVALTQVVLDGSAVWIAPSTINFSEVCQALEPNDHEASLTFTERIVLANVIAHNVRKAYTSADVTVAREVLRFDCETLATSGHQAVASRTTSVSSIGFRNETERFESLLAAEPISAGEFSRRAARLTDLYFGVFRKPDEADLTQLPLRVSRTEYVVPGRKARNRRITVCGTGIDPFAARHAAAVEAITGYSALVSDRSRLPGEEPIPCYDLVNSLMTQERFDGPNLIWRAGVPRLRPGIGSGYNLDTAVVEGLLSICKQQTVTELRHNPLPRKRIRVADLSDDPTIHYVWAMLGAVASVDIVDLTYDELGVPAVGIAVDGVTCAVGCGISTAAATADGLLLAAAAWQSRTNQEPAYLPAETDTLPALPDIDGYLDVSERTLTRSDLVERLSRNGSTVHAALLDADSEAFDVLPVARVLVRQEASDDDT